MDPGKCVGRCALTPHAVASSDVKVVLLLVLSEHHRLEIAIIHCGSIRKRSNMASSAVHSNPSKVCTCIHIRIGLCTLQKSRLQFSSFFHVGKHPGLFLSYVWMSSKSAASHHTRRFDPLPEMSTQSMSEKCQKKVHFVFSFSGVTLTQQPCNQQHYQSSCWSS